jgi:hypothetical protein
MMILTIVASAAAQEIVPPSTDFSKFEKKYTWQLSKEFIDQQAARMKQENVVESKVHPYTLPEIFVLKNGKRVQDKAAWEKSRRAELLDLFRSEVYGVAPVKPGDLSFRVVESDRNAMGGKATLKRVAIGFRLQDQPFTFHLTLFVPNQRRGKAPVFLLLNHRNPDNTDPTRKIKSEFWPAEYAIDRGYAMAAVNVADEVDPDKRDATTGIRAFYRQHSAKPAEFTWATISAWAWSGLRAMDYFETDSDIDTRRVAVVGHSRGGKTSLWAGAQDTRFSLVCVNDAGEGGPSLSRRDFGETLGQITRNFPYWFTPKYSTYADKVDKLPIDQHELVALVAPRGYHGADASHDLHADPKGSWLALVEASKAWVLYGKPVTRPEMPMVNDLMVNGPIGYHIREGGHGLTMYDWKLYLDHADRLWK